MYYKKGWLNMAEKKTLEELMGNTIKKKKKTEKTTKTPSKLISFKADGKDQEIINKALHFAANNDLFPDRTKILRAFIRYAKIDNSFLSTLKDVMS